MNDRVFTIGQPQIHGRGPNYFCTNHSNSIFTNIIFIVHVNRYFVTTIFTQLVQNKIENTSPRNFTNFQYPSSLLPNSYHNLSVNISISNSPWNTINYSFLYSLWCIFPNYFEIYYLDNIVFCVCFFYFRNLQ
jgi:hypothetical protein